MMLAIVLVVALGVASAQNTESPIQTTTLALDGPTVPSKTMTRDLPADVLRDFGGLCFASTLCRVFEVGQSWPLAPFCGQSSCVLSPDGFLIERVNDCGIIPKENPRCKVINEDARNETYPACCPVFQCEKGVTLEIPTPEELQATFAPTTLPTDEAETTTN